MGIISKDKKKKNKENTGSFYSDKPYNVTINKYNSKQAVLDLIAYISTAANDFDVDVFFEDFYNKCGLPKYSYDILDRLMEDEDFARVIGDLKNDIRRIAIETSSEIKETNGDANIKIAVGGGYSSGKSSFLNEFLNLGALLPTGPVPVSVVNTFLNTSTEIKDIRVKGLNLRGSYVLLDEEVLDCIQHASKSKTYVASVLKSLIIDFPAPSKELRNLTFIDTPGYNNSNSKNAENNRTDMETAREAYQFADAIIWCIDMEGGTVPDTDINILRSILNDDPQKTVAVIFTKRDKKSDSEQKKILLNASNILRSKLQKSPDVLLAFSDRLDNKYLTFKGLGINHFIGLLRSKKGNSKDNSCKEDALRRLCLIFDDILKLITDSLDNLDKKRIKLSEEKSKISKDVANSKDFNKSMLSDIVELVANDYGTLVQERSKLIDYLGELWDKNCDFREHIANSVENATIFSGRDNLEAIIRRYDTVFDSYIDRVKNYLETVINAFNDEAVNRMVDDIKFTYKYYDDDRDNINDSARENYESVVKNIRNLKELGEFIKKWKSSAFSQFEQNIEMAISGIRRHLKNVPKIEKENSGDIFSAIAADNIKRFVDCLSSGVNMAECNASGFSPLTYVAYSGNNQMMQYLIDHDVNLDLADKRGYTPFETAVICHYQDICEMLIEANEELAETNHPIEELLEANKFSKWICEKCH